MIAFYCVPHARLETEVEHVAADGNPSICRPCADLMGSWLDVKASDLRPGASFAHGSGAPYDASVAGLRDRLVGNGEALRRLVRTQRAAVAACCRAGVHAPGEVP